MESVRRYSSGSDGRIGKDSPLILLLLLESALDGGNTLTAPLSLSLSLSPAIHPSQNKTPSGMTSGDHGGRGGDRGGDRGDGSTHPRSRLHP
jgi:hypothetical protein